MAGRASNWATINARSRMRQHGSEAVEEAGEKGPAVKALFQQEGDRNKRLRHWLETSPRGERDAEELLERQQDTLLPQEPRRRDGTRPPRQTRAQRDTWLRGVLDACGDE